jgi:hypothetical protein
MHGLLMLAQAYYYPTYPIGCTIPSGLVILLTIASAQTDRMTIPMLGLGISLFVFVLHVIRCARQYMLSRHSVPPTPPECSGNQKIVKPGSTRKDLLRPGTNDPKHPRLSRPSSYLKPAYDVVVIGSGYGGGVAASRFARAGKSVCVLERGAEKWPGEYPHTASSALEEYEVSGQVSGKSIRFGKSAGLFQTIKGEGQDIFMGCGLGGTSLINGGVWLRADNRVLRGREWPVELREGVLDEYYRRAEQMLKPTPYPSTYPTPLKLSALETQARSLGLQKDWYRPPLTTSFSSGINQAGIHMKASTGSGNECTGTNDGSKNSILVTYLTDAWARGAEIFCGIDVRYLRKRERHDGYVIFFEVMESNGAKRLSWVFAVSCASLSSCFVLQWNGTHEQCQYRKIS